MLALGLPERVEDAEKLPDREDGGEEDAEGEGVAVVLRHSEGDAVPVVDVVALAHLVMDADSVAKLLVAMPVPLPLPLPRADGVVVSHCEGLPVHEGDTEELSDEASDGVACPLADPLREPPLPLESNDADDTAVAVAQRLGDRLALANSEAEPLLLGEREAATHEDGLAEREGCDALADAVEDDDHEVRGEKDALSVPDADRDGDGELEVQPLGVNEAHGDGLAESLSRGVGEKGGLNDAEAEPHAVELGHGLLLNDALWVPLLLATALIEEQPEGGAVPLPLAETGGEGEEDTEVE